MKRKPVEQTEAEKLYDMSYPVLMAPWHGHLTPIQVRHLSATQALACGDFSMIELFGDALSEGREPTLEQMNAYAERQHMLCKLAMVKPTFDEAMKIAGAHIDSAQITKQLKEIKEIWKDCPVGPERAALKREYDALELVCKFILPPDFMAFVTNYCLQIDKSDIKSVTEELLLNAAVLASRGHDNPSDHVGGVFTDLMRREIDNRAWVLLDAEQKRNSPRKSR